MSLRPTPLPQGTELRRATRGDNADILRYLARHAMRGRLALRFDRSPDFFALHDAQGSTHETWLLVDGDGIVGLGSIVLRPGYIAGRAETVAYLGELRMSQRRKTAGLWHQLWLKRSRELSTTVRYAYCSIIRSNRLARASVLNKAAAPRFQHLGGYANVSILTRKPWKPRLRDKRYTIRRAETKDSRALRRFLDSHARRQPFGVVFDDATWQGRLNHWPDFGIDHFYLAFAGPQRLVGCLAPWDASSINRVVIEHLPPSAQWLQRAYNAASPLMRKPKIASGTGAHLPDIALTHLCVEGRDPDILGGLLDNAYADIAATRRYATASLCLYDDDPLWPALARFWHYAVPMDLYWLALEAAAPPLDADAIPGFESYLV